MTKNELYKELKVKYETAQAQANWYFEQLKALAREILNEHEVD